MFVLSRRCTQESDADKDATKVNENKPFRVEWALSARYKMLCRGLMLFTKDCLGGKQWDVIEHSERWVQIAVIARTIRTAKSHKKPVSPLQLD